MSPKGRPEGELPHSAQREGSPVSELPLVDARSVTLQYKTADRRVTATWRVDFQVFPGERFAILGPSGCGKSTLLKAIGGYLVPADGEILLKGIRIGKPGPDRMMVFQEFDQLLPWRTVRENVAFPLVASGRCAPRDAALRADASIVKVGLADFADSYPHVLSGGMKQRVAIARALAMEPDVLLMDEPFASLDALTRLRMQDELLALWSDTKFTIVFVTHSIAEAVKVGSRILLLTPRPGQVRAELNSVPPEADAAARVALEQRIHALLFAEAADLRGKAA